MSCEGSKSLNIYTGIKRDDLRHFRSSERQQAFRWTVIVQTHIRTRPTAAPWRGHKVVAVYVAIKDNSHRPSRRNATVGLRRVGWYELAMRQTVVKSHREEEVSCLGAEATDVDDVQLD